MASLESSVTSRRGTGHKFPPFLLNQQHHRRRMPRVDVVEMQVPVVLTNFPHNRLYSFNNNNINNNNNNFRGKSLQCIAERGTRPGIPFDQCSLSTVGGNDNDNYINDENETNSNITIHRRRKKYTTTTITTTTITKIVLPQMRQVDNNNNNNNNYYNSEGIPMDAEAIRLAIEREESNNNYYNNNNNNNNNMEFVGNQEDNNNYYNTREAAPHLILEKLSERRKSSSLRNGKNNSSKHHHSNNNNNNNNNNNQNINGKEVTSSKELVPYNFNSPTHESLTETQQEEEQEYQQQQQPLIFNHRTVSKTSSTTHHPPAFMQFPENGKILGKYKRGSVSPVLTSSHSEVLQPMPPNNMINNNINNNNNINQPWIMHEERIEDEWHTKK